jgi:hypothetical protein
MENTHTHTHTHTHKAKKKPICDTNVTSVSVLYKFVFPLGPKVSIGDFMADLYLSSSF